MNAKKQLYYLLEHYFKGDYTTQLFADEFSRVYDQETNYGLLSDAEGKLMKELADITNYFSAYEEDFEKYPNFYSNEQDVKRKATEVYLELTGKKNDTQRL